MSIRDPKNPQERPQTKVDAEPSADFRRVCEGESSREHAQTPDAPRRGSPREDGDAKPRE
jgi:hypothetical protein